MNTEKGDPDDFVPTSLPGFEEAEEVSGEETGKEVAPAWELKKLTARHLQICALLAQGMKNVEVAAAVGVVPQYIPMLLRQPLVKQEILRITSVASVKLEAMFEQSVETLGDILRNGSNGEKLKAIRAHGELTHRIGRPDPLANTPQVNEDRLAVLAERLVSLARGARNGPETIIDAEFTVRSGEDRNQAQE